MGRRPLELKHPKLHSHVVDFAALPALPRVDDVFIALGTTIKVAGSQAAFRAVDFDSVVAVASAARSFGATHLGVVSAMGAGLRSPVFYNRVKGEMEQAVSALGYESVVIARPSMLDGDRESLNQAARPAERIGLAVMALLRPVTPANLPCHLRGRRGPEPGQGGQVPQAGHPYPFVRRTSAALRPGLLAAPGSPAAGQPRTNNVTSGSGPTCRLQ